MDGDVKTYQLPLPPPFFFVLVGSESAKPDLAKYLGMMTWRGAPSATAWWSRLLNFCVLVTMKARHVSRLVIELTWYDNEGRTICAGSLRVRLHKRQDVRGVRAGKGDILLMVLGAAKRQDSG